MMKDQIIRSLLATAAVSLVACGGGGGGTDTSSTATTLVIGASSQYAQQCDANNPAAPAANKTGSLAIEKQWIRSYLNEAYLWFDQIPTVNASASTYSGAMSTLTAYNVPAPLDSYFQALKSPQLTASGAKVDKFSFTYSTADWNAYAQSGQSGGYGADIALLAKSAPRKAVVAYTDPNTPAYNAPASLRRGAEILSVDGVDLVNDTTQAGVAKLNAGLFPNVGETHTFVVRDLGATSTRTVTLKAQTITSTPVQNVQTLSTSTGKVGYLQFNDHIATSEQMLIDAVNKFKADGIQDLVLDMRYNGGGYLFIASELAYMIAGPSRAYASGQSKVFEKLTYNSKRSAETNASNATTPFYNASCIMNSSYNCTATNALPYLGLSRVFVLAQAGTCSASEAVVNGLRGVGVDVKIIGGTTCGKPYGFTAKDNCGVSYFPIEFKGVNAAGFGDYSDGFAPTCTVSDDFSKQLGDPTEGQLAGALKYQTTGACPSAAVATEKSLSVGGGAAAAYTLLKNPLRENRWGVPRP